MQYEGNWEAISNLFCGLSHVIPKHVIGTI